MRNYLCKWPDGSVVLVSARDKQQVREILNEVEDPSGCEVVRMKGAFALELKPRVPDPPPPTQPIHDPRVGIGPSGGFAPPLHPTTRPRITRWVGTTGQTVYADLYHAYGGQLQPAELAALQRWMIAAQQQQVGHQQQQLLQQQQQGRRAGAAAAAATAAEPWVTEQQLRESGLLIGMPHIQVDISRTRYGRYTDHLHKKITKNFFPRTYEALKMLADIENDFDGFDYEAITGGPEPTRQDAIMELRAALSHDVEDKETQDALDHNQAKLLADASNGDQQAMMRIMTQHTANPYGRELDDLEENMRWLDTDEESLYGDDDSDDSAAAAADFMRVAQRMGMGMAAPMSAELPVGHMR